MEFFGRNDALSVDVLVMGRGGVGVRRALALDFDVIAR